MADDRIIIALDFPGFAEAKACIDALGESVSYYKVGMELYYADGPEVIAYLKKLNKKVFLDLKLYDIPNTVASALKVLAALDIDMINIHASGGSKMMYEAAKAIKDFVKSNGRKSCPKLIAVTMLTSFDEEQFVQLNYKNQLSEQVLALAKLAKNCGLDGVVASSLEAEIIKKECGTDFLIVTPGIRPVGASLDDQSRVATPQNALQMGSTHLVIGRPVTKAVNKVQAVEEIIKEIRGV